MLTEIISNNLLIDMKVTVQVYLSLNPPVDLILFLPSQPRNAVPLQMFKIQGQWREGMNVLGLVMFSVILGATIGKMREKGKPIQDFLVAMSEAMMIITRWVIW